jgi:hypothetical protein
MPTQTDKPSESIDRLAIIEEIKRRREIIKSADPGYGSQYYEKVTAKTKDDASRRSIPSDAAIPDNPKHVIASCFFCQSLKSAAAPKVESAAVPK